MKNDTWFMPEYYQSFKCKADKCRNTCCRNWRIPVSKGEYEKLINMECSDELYSRVQRSFEVPDFIDEKCYRYISFNWLGQCPLQEKGLCSIHKEKGEEFLPKICRLYPRSFKRINDYNIASCSSSCEAVLEQLYNGASMKIVSGKLNESHEIFYEISEEDIDQIALFQNIIKDKSTSLAQSISDICLIVNKEEFEKDINRDTDALKQGLNLFERFAKSNIEFEDITKKVVDRYKGNDELYKQDVERFEEAYPEWMSYFEKVINNSMIYENFPFVDKRSDRTDSYKGLCVCYGLMRIMCVGIHNTNPGIDNIIDGLSALFHLIDHTPFYYNIAILAENSASMLKL